MAMTESWDARDVAWAARLGETLADELTGALSCSREAVALSVMCLLSGGHLLLEDVPGVGKTTLARALGRVVRARVTRVQFTPDMLPSDLTGVSVWDPEARAFTFHPGPLFSDMVLADEVNRANPKTQSALLEAMEEGRVSVDGTTYELPDPYFVMATQNPVEMEGTYPLPEAQLDRFMVRASLGYPAEADERAMLAGVSGADPVARVRAVCDLGDVRRFRDLAARVHVGDEVADYALRMLSATREAPEVRLGASPRAGLALVAISRTHALLDGRTAVFPEDVRSLAPAVLSHRLVLRDAQPGTSQAAQQRATLVRLMTRVAAPRPRR
ncbi:AAA family ATPase [Thermophilibacter sp.]